MDDIERGQEREQQDRALCLEIARNKPQRDYAGEICTECDYATRSNFGRSCESWRECLQDQQKRERAGQ